MGNKLSKFILKIIIVILVSIVLFAVGIPIISMIIGSGYESLFISVLVFILVMGIIIDQFFRKKR